MEKEFSSVKEKANGTGLLKALWTATVVCVIGSTSLEAQTTPLVVKANEIKGNVQPTMWGVFFEDINMGADGGIYAELIKNRSFEFFRPLMGWKVLGKPQTEGDFLVMNRGKADTANPRFLHVTLHKAAKGSLGLNNEGFRGMGVKKELGYDFSVMYRQSSPSLKMYLELVDEKGQPIGGTSITTTSSGDAWKKATATFTATAPAQKGSFNLWFEGDGTVDLDMISLFPKDTWKGRPGGMRADMIQMLADMKPGFVRFPGGCIVEGFDLSQRYQWKKTIGPVDQRQLIINRWNFEFAHRPTPDYFQTFGLGFFEYFQLCEDNSKAGKWEKLASGPNFAPNCAYLGWGVYVMARVDSDSKKQKAAWSAAAHLGGKDLSLWTVMYPSGFQVHRQSHFDIPEWTGAGYNDAYITSYLKSQSGSYNHPNRAIEPRIPGIFQYYSVAEDELAKIFAGKATAQQGADAIAAAWEKVTDTIGREKQIALYKASMGL